MTKPKVGIFGLTGCAGCQLEILNLEEQVLNLLALIDVSYWRMAQELPADPTNLDIAFIEGSITNEEEIHEVKEIRENANLVITIGSCAGSGGVQGMRNIMDNDKVKAAAYKDLSGVRSVPVKGVDEVIKVDYKIRGCPINRDDFVSIVTSLLLGRQPHVWNSPVCNECSMQNNDCFFERTTETPIYRSNICLGPITEAGCGARCPSNGMPCDGCRGLTSDPHISQLVTEARKRGETTEKILMLAKRYSAGSSAVKKSFEEMR